MYAAIARSVNSLHFKRDLEKLSRFIIKGIHSLMGGCHILLGCACSLKYPQTFACDTIARAFMHIFHIPYTILF